MIITTNDLTSLWYRIHSSIMSNKIQIGIAIAVLVLTIGIASGSLFTTSASGQNLTQGNQTGNQTTNQTSPATAQVPGSASQGNSGSSEPQY